MMQMRPVNVKSLDGLRVVNAALTSVSYPTTISAVPRRGQSPLKHQTFDRHIVAGLVRALDWFDNGLQNILRQRGYRSVHRTQSMIIVHIASGLDRPADIAREMGLTRQNIHHMAKSLIDEGLIQQRAVPEDARSNYYAFTPESEDIRAAARETLGYLEKVLIKRIGRDAVRDLKSALGKDWGSEVTEMPAVVRSGNSSKKKGKRT